MSEGDQQTDRKQQIAMEDKQSREEVRKAERKRANESGGEEWKSDDEGNSKGSGSRSARGTAAGHEIDEKIELGMAEGTTLGELSAPKEATRFG